MAKLPGLPYSPENSLREGESITGMIFSLVVLSVSPRKRTNKSQILVKLYSFNGLSTCDNSFSDYYSSLCDWKYLAHCNYWNCCQVVSINNLIQKLIKKYRSNTLVHLISISRTDVLSLNCSVINRADPNHSIRQHHKKECIVRRNQRERGKSYA